MNSKIPAVILGLLVLLAIIFRINNPPSKIPPGPLGHMPSWISSNQIGKLDDQSINMDASLWAGVWNQKIDDKSRAAVRVIDFSSNSSKLTYFKDNAYIADLFWVNNTTLRILVLDTDKLDKVKESSIIDLDSNNGNVIKTTKLPVATLKIFAWSKDFSSYSALYKDQNGQTLVAIFDITNNVVNKPVAIELPKNTSFGNKAALSADNKSFIFSVSDSMNDISAPYYLVNSVSGTIKKAFITSDIPGKIEFMSLSDLGVVIVASARDKFNTVVYNLADSKIVMLHEYSNKAALIKLCPDLPKDMMFISYSKGYNYNPIEEKTTPLFSMAGFNKDEDLWRMEVQGGRLYPSKDGSYISVSYSIGTADIRVISKDGHMKNSILPRQ